MAPSITTDNDNSYALVEGVPAGYFTEVFVTSNSDQQQIVTFDIDGTETKIEGTGDGEQIGNFKLPDSFNTIKVYVSYVDDNGNVVPADSLETSNPFELMGYNKGFIKAENGDDDDDYEIEIEFEGKIKK